MTEDEAPYDDGKVTCAARDCDVRFTPTSDNHRCCCARCRARRSRERKQQGPGPGQVTGCRIVRGGAVSVTVHLPPDQRDRIHELATGQWVQVTPHGEQR